MSQTIKLKRSAVAGKVPTTSSLDLGELALNTNDGKVFFKKDDGTPSIQTIVTTNSLTTGSVNISGSITASTAQIASLNYPTSDGTDGQVLTTDGAGNLAFETPIAAAAFPYTGSATISGSLIVDGPTTSTTLSASYIDLDPLTDGSEPAYREGRIFYSADDGALTVYNSEADITLQVGQEIYKKVKNQSGATILNGTPVRVSGSSGQNPLVWPATAPDHTSTGGDVEIFVNHVIGIATHDIGDNSIGFVTETGVVNDLDTSKFNAGDLLFLQTGSPALPSDY